MFSTTKMQPAKTNRLTDSAARTILGVEVENTQGDSKKMNTKPNKTVNIQAE